MKKKRKKAKYDWQAIRQEYVISPAGKNEITLEMLAGKWRCKLGYLYQKSSEEDWPKLREEHRRKVEGKTKEKAVETETERRIRHAKIMRIIQASGITAIQNSDIKASPRDTIEAVKMERALYGETNDNVHIEITDRDRKIAAAYKRAMAELGDDVGKEGVVE